MPTIKRAQELVHGLESDKGFGHNLRDKIMWMGEEYGELIHAYKHNNMNKVAEEAIDVFFFVVSILEILKENGDEIFMKKLVRNILRQAVKKDKEMHFDITEDKMFTKKFIKINGKKFKVPRCLYCGRLMKPAKDITQKKITGYVWKCDCPKFPKNIVVGVG